MRPQILFAIRSGNYYIKSGNKAVLLKDVALITPRGIWQAAMGWLERPPTDDRSWLKIAGAVTLFSLLWGLSMSFIVVRTYSLKPPTMNWRIPSLMYLTDAMLGSLFEASVLIGSIFIVAMIVWGQKRVGLLVLFSVPISIFYGLGHRASFSEFTDSNMAALHALTFQGVLFFSWCLLFIKCIDPRSMFQFKALAAVLLAHFLYNVLIIKLMALCL